MKLLVAVFWALNCLRCLSEAAKILAIFPFPTKSHYAPFEPLLKELAGRGHDLQVVSVYPQKKQIPNFTDIEVLSDSPKSLGTMPLPVNDNFTIWATADILLNYFSPGICRAILSDSKITQLLETDEKFDLIIAEVFITDCFLGFAHKFRVPYVGASSSVAMPWIPDILATPDNPSYIPQLFSHYTDRMNYFQRFLNAFYLSALKIGYKIYSDKLGYEIAKGYFGPDLPSFDDLRSKVGLLLVNAHHSVSAPRALAPGVKEVGGIHIPKSGPPQLPRDLQDYLDSATEGVLYFSLGSQLNSSSISDKNMANFLRAFAQLSQRVLWKCNEREMPRLPNNVKCIDWAPQLSVLCHPNVRVFLSHGGLLGTQEAVYCGVPVLGMPLFGDQFLNIAYAVDRGFALKIEYHNPSYKEFATNLKRLLTEPSFSERAKEASRRFRDRPQAPLDEAVFWVEYVLRHGPDALRTAASELAWYQYLLLDVVAGIFAVILFVLWILKKLAVAIFSRKKGEVKIVKQKEN